MGILNPRPGAENGLRDPGDGLVLTDHTLMQNVLHVQQLFPLALHQLGDGNTRPALDDAGNLLLCDLIPEEGAALTLVGNGLFLFQLLLELGQLPELQLAGFFVVVAPLGNLQIGFQLLDLFPQPLHPLNGVLLVVPLGLFGVEVLPEIGQFLLQLAQPLLGECVCLLFQGSLLNFQLDDLPGDHVQFGGHGVDLGTDEGAGLVHQIDGLVRQEPVGDVPVGEGGSGNQGVILNLDAVKHLVPLLQAPENGNGVLDGGLIHHDRLEPALQSGVLFDVLPVLVQGRCADAVQLAPCQHGL